MAHEEVRLQGGEDRAFSPNIGDTTVGLREWLVKKGTFSDSTGFDPVLNDALAIVRNCLPFKGPDGTRTGLVIGYVQSGKTVSMEVVSAIASDNGCRIVILLAGVTTNLLVQNAERFRKDLREASGSSRVWKIFNSQHGFGNNEKQILQQAVEEWREGRLAEEDQQTFLFMVLKNHAHLERLRGLLAHVSLAGIPALILDDEADQAGLNTAVAKGEESTTYQRIKSVRSLLPHHTYLQYTATPQALLLIALDDMLSPAFAELVEPGQGYTGGSVFFGMGENARLVRTIPSEDLFKPGAPPDTPPESLLDAMRVFLLGCAIASTRGVPTPRSMLVHPSPRTNDHKKYLTWIQEARKRWSESLANQESGEYKDVLDEFQEAYEDLKGTDRDLPRLDELAQKLRLSVSRVSLKEVNSEDGSEIDWENAAEHVLVGGEKLNRGFTVEGLTVTYMPRDAGDWNADTIQQRARFFGYKRKYLSLCRLYLAPDVVHAFRAYVRHEEDVRSQLREHRGRPLREWRRAFFMDARMRPTRRNVLSDPFFRVNSKHPWFVQEQPQLDQDAAASNSALLFALEQRLSFSSRKDFFKHTVCEIDLDSFFREILLGYQVRGTDLASWYGQLVMLRDILDTTPDARLFVVRMYGSRERTLTSGEIKLHQGRSSARGEDKYPGDAKMCDGHIVTVQIHWLRIEDDPSLIPGLAVHIPENLRKDDVVARP